MGDRLEAMRDKIRGAKGEPLGLLYENSLLGLEFYELTERELVAEPPTPARDCALTCLDRLKRTTTELVALLEEVQLS